MNFQSQCIPVCPTRISTEKNGKKNKKTNISHNIQLQSQITATRLQSNATLFLDAHFFGQSGRITRIDSESVVGVETRNYINARRSFV
jgi:hypothetical protein